MSETGEHRRPDTLSVFISYARVDRARVDPIAQALRSRGVSVWIDSALVAGEVFATEIETALRSADAVVVVWSETSVQSTWVREEATLGHDLRRLVPVGIDPVRSPLGFGQYHVLDLTNWTGDPAAAEIESVLQALRKLAGGAPDRPAFHPASFSHLHRSGPSRRTWLIGSAVAAAPLAVGAWWIAGHGMGFRAARPHSIAVLPFDNLSGDPKQDYFADGLSEEVRSALARIDSLQIAAPTSSLQFRHAKQDVRSIGSALGVAYVLDGSVQASGNKVRVFAHLSEAATGFEKWAQTYDRTVTDILAIQADIASLVVNALSVKVMGVAPAIALGQTANPAAYDAYLRGRHALFAASGDESTYREALEDFNAAIAADPNFASAYALRARTLIAIAGQFGTPAQLPGLTSDAIHAAERAVQLAPDLDVAQSILAFARLYGALDVKGAAEPFEKSRELGQGNADVLSRYGLYAARIGNFQAAMTALQRAAVLDPLNPSVLTNLGVTLYSARHFVDALAPLARALALNPKMNFVHAARGDCLLAQGQFANAKIEYAAEPSPLGRLPGLAIVERKLGDNAAADSTYQKLLTDLGDSALYQQAQVLTQWGRREQALDVLNRAFIARDSGLILLDTDPKLDDLRHTPRFIRLRGQLGFA